MSQQTNSRLWSLDALRGFDMLFIMGFSGFVIALCALSDAPFAGWLAEQMRHVKWDGFQHHDTIFPLFLFIAGVSFPYSLATQRAKGMSEKQIHLKILRRALILIALGVVYNGFFKLDFENMRIASVLGRIGVAWAVAALLYIHCGVRTRGIIALVVLLGYWALSVLVPAPDAVAGADALSREGCLVGYIDRILLPGRLIYDTFDPEGLLSTLPAVVTAMLGNFAGEWVRQPEQKVSGNRKAAYMAVAGAVMALVAWGWNEVLPVNKMLWSSSFVVAVGGYSLLMFALFYYIIDVRGWRRWTLFFRVIGLNSITIYLAQKIIDFRKVARFFLGGVADMCPEDWGNVILAGGYVVACWLFLYFLYKKETFLKV